MKPIHVGLLGFGTVGRGTWDVLRRNHEEIQRRAGRPIVVRFTWSSITKTSARWEQDFSPDGGRTWEKNWIMTHTRIG